MVSENRVRHENAKTFLPSSCVHVSSVLCVSNVCWLSVLCMYVSLSVCLAVYLSVCLKLCGASSACCMYRTCACVFAKHMYVCVKCMRVCGGSGQTPLLRREGVAQKCISYFKVFKIIFKLVVISASIVRSYLSSPSEWNQLFKI